MATLQNEIATQSRSKPTLMWAKLELEKQMFVDKKNKFIEKVYIFNGS